VNCDNAGALAKHLLVNTKNVADGFCLRVTMQKTQRPKKISVRNFNFELLFNFVDEELQAQGAMPKCGSKLMSLIL